MNDECDSVTKYINTIIQPLNVHKELKVKLFH